MTAANADTAEYITLNDFPDYEIKTTYPHHIRRKVDKHCIKPRNNDKKNSTEDNYYERITLNKRNKYVHRIIAAQFIPNPNGYKYVDHINRIKCDNRIENLRWTDASDNNRNKTSYKNIECNYIDSLSDNKIKINKYNEHNLTCYYYDNDKFYYHNGNQYRELNLITDKKSGASYVNVIDSNRKRVHIYLNKFKKIINEMNACNKKA